jgi:uncharacterized BrkB/YihY/UPF0761 family membrane protein
MRKLVCFVDHEGTQCHLPSFLSKMICQIDSCNTAQYLTAFPLLALLMFFLITVKLNATTVKPQSIVPGSIVQFLWFLNKYYLNYGNITRMNNSSIYRFLASIAQNFCPEER